MDVFPEIKLFPSLDRLKKLAHFLLDHVQHEPKPYESDHYRTTTIVEDGNHTWHREPVNPSDESWERPSGW